MQKALEALESDPISHAGLVSRKQAIAALRQALVDADDTSQKRVDEKAKREHEWVGLTDEDIHDAFNFTEMVKQLSWDREPEQWCENFAAYIEAKIKDKNHG